MAAVWDKATPIVGAPPAIVRTDPYGKVMARAAYGDTQSAYGWEVDHIQPVTKGGTDELANLRPLHWEMNRQKGDQYPWDYP